MSVDPEILRQMGVLQPSQTERPSVDTDILAQMGVMPQGLETAQMAEQAQPLERAAPLPPAQPAEPPRAQFQFGMPVSAFTPKPQPAPEGKIGKAAEVVLNILGAGAQMTAKGVEEATGELYEQGPLAGMQSYKDVEGFGLGERYATLGTGRDETAKIVKQFFKDKVGEDIQMRDVDGHKVFTDPRTGQEHAIPDIIDLPNLAMMIGEEAAISAALAATTGGTGTVARWLARAPKIVRGIDKFRKSSGAVRAGVGGAALETKRQLTEEAYGGDFDKLDVALAGGLEGTTRLGGKYLEAKGKQGIMKTVKQASEGSPEALDKVKQLHASDPEALENVLEVANMKPFDPNKGVLERIDAADLDPRLEAYKYANNITEDPTDLARSLNVDKKLIEDAKDLGYYHRMQPYQLMDIMSENDASFDLVDAVRHLPQGGGAEGKFRKQKIRFKEDIKNIFSEDTRFLNLSEENDRVNKIFEASKANLRGEDGKSGLIKEKYDALQQAIKALPDPPVATADETLDFIKKQKQGVLGVSPEDKAKMTTDELMALKKFEELDAFYADVQAKLQPRRIPISKGVQKSPTPTAVDTKRYVKAETTLDSMLQTKRYVGNIASNPNHKNYVEANKLYKTLSSDYDEAFEKSGLGQSVLDLKNDADQTYMDYQDLLKREETVRGKNLDKSFMETAGPKANKMAKGNTDELIKYMDAIPEAERGPVFENFVMSKFFPEDKGLKIDAARGFLNMYTQNKRFRTYLKSKKILTPAQDKTLEAYSGAFNAIAGAGERSALNEGYLKEIVSQKVGVLNELGRRVIRGGAATAAGRLTMPFMGAGSYAVGMSVLDAMTGFFNNLTEAKAKKLSDFFTSSEIKELMATDLSKKAISDFSEKQKNLVFARQMGLADDSMGLERVLNSYIRSDQPNSEED